MADLQIVAQATHVPTASTTTRTITVPAGVQDGDTIHVFLTKPGGSTVGTLSGGSGYTEEAPVQGAGLSSQYWHKTAATTADAGVTLTVTTTTAIQCSMFVVVTRGQKSTVEPVVNTTAYALSKTRVLPSVTATARVGYLVFMSGTGIPDAVTDFTASPALTKLGQIINSTGGAGAASSALWWGGPVASGATYGGNTLTIVDASLNTAAWLVALELEEAVVEDTVYPASTVSNTGWTAVGAGTVHAALADSSDATYVETGDNPAGSVFTVGLNELGDGDITVRTRNVATASAPAITRQITLMQGSTVIASRDVVLTTVIAPHAFTLTTEELALVTDRSALRVRITDTAS
jgi:hypothetical protein